MKNISKTRCDWGPRGGDLMVAYHDQEWGVPVHDDRLLFEFLILEGAQAGLSWSTVLKKRERYRQVFAGFDPARVARFGAADVRRLLADPGIIRNRLKVEAAIENAKRILVLRKSHGSFAEWLDAHHPRDKTEWVRLFKKTFVFTGGEITGSFLLSTGYLEGAHERECPVFGVIAGKKPAWMREGG